MTPAVRVSCRHTTVSVSKAMQLFTGADVSTASYPHLDGMIDKWVRDMMIERVLPNESWVTT